MISQWISFFSFFFKFPNEISKVKFDLIWSPICTINERFISHAHPPPIELDFSKNFFVHGLFVYKWNWRFDLQIVIEIIEFLFLVRVKSVLFLFGCETPHTRWHVRFRHHAEWTHTHPSIPEICIYKPNCTIDKCWIWILHSYLIMWKCTSLVKSSI